MAIDAVDGAVVIGVDADTKGFDDAISDLGDEAQKSFSEVLESLQEVDSAIDTLAKAYENTSREAAANFQSGGAVTDQYTQSLDILAREIEALQSKLAELKDAKQTADTAFQNHEIDYEQYSAFNAEISETALQLENLKDQYDALKEGGEDTYIKGISEDLGNLDENADNAGQSVFNLGDLIKANLTSTAVSAAVKELLKLIKELGEELTGIVVNAAAMGDTIDKQSQRLGMTTDAYQEWSYILSQNGADISTLTMSMRTLTNQIDGLKNGSKSATEAFAQLGLQLSDLQGLTGEQQLSLVIERLQGIEDETQRNAVANDVLGRSYMQLIPLLNQTSDSVAALKERAHETNQLMTEDGVNAAVRYTDALDTLTRSFEGFKNNLGAQVLPGITEVIEGITDLVNGVEGAEERISTGIDMAFSALEDALPQVEKILENIGDLFAGEAPIIITKLVNGISDRLPAIMAAGGRVLLTLIQAINDNLDTLASSSALIVTTIFNGIIEKLADPETYKNIFEIMGELGYNLVMGIADGVLNFDWEGMSTRLVRKLATVFNDAQKQVKVWIDNFWTGGEVYGGDVANAGDNGFYSYVMGDKYEEDLKNFWSDVRSDFEAGKEQIDEWYESGKKAMGLDLLDHEAEKVEKEAEEAAEQIETASKTVTQAIVTTAEKEKDKLNEALQEKLDALDHDLKTHRISEVEYWAKRKALLEQYREDDNAAWWELYDDTIEHYKTLGEKIATGITEANKKYKQKMQEAENLFRSSADTIINNVRSEINGNINTLQSSFGDILKTYQKGYNDIINQRNAYKQKLMGGSIFEVLQLTDEETGEQYTQYTINDMKKRLSQRTQYAQQMAALEQRDLAKGLMQELEGLDAETALVFAKQLNNMSDAEFTELNDIYNKLDEETSRLADERYQDELENLQTSFIDQCTALFEGMDADLKSLGADGVNAYLEAFKSGFENDGADIAESVTKFFEDLKTAVSNGDVDISELVTDAFSDSGYEIGANMVDQMIQAVNDKKTDYQQALEDMISLTGFDMTIANGMNAQAAAMSQAGYTAAAALTPTTTTATAATGTQAGTGVMTISANLKLVDGAGRIIADIVNAENKQLQIGAGA